MKSILVLALAYLCTALAAYSIAPSGITSLAGVYQSNYSKVKLTWNHDGQNVDEFKILRKGWGESTWMTHAYVGGSARSYVDTSDISSSRNWTYAVRAQNGGEVSGYSSLTVWKIIKAYSQPPNVTDNGVGVWMSIPPGGSMALSSESRLEIKKTNQWSDLSSELDVVLLYRSAVLDADIAELREFVDAMAAANIGIAVEFAGLAPSKAADGDQTGENAFASDFSVMRRITDSVADGGAGGTIDYLVFDGPIHRTVYPDDEDAGYHTIASAAQELVDAMLLWRAEYPNANFVLLSNFSNWAWNGVPARNDKGLPPGEKGFGDYEDVLNAVLPLASSNGVPFSAVAADFAYDAFNNEGSTNQASVVENLDYKARLKNFRDHIVNNRNLMFTLISNSNRGSNLSNYAFRVECLNYIQEVYDENIIPDILVLQTWNLYPSKWLSENTKDTMTQLTRRALERIRYGTDPYPQY